MVAAMMLRKRMRQDGPVGNWNKALSGSQNTAQGIKECGWIRMGSGFAGGLWRADGPVPLLTETQRSIKQQTTEGA